MSRFLGLVTDVLSIICMVPLILGITVVFHILIFTTWCYNNKSYKQTAREFRNEGSLYEGI